MTEALKLSNKWELAIGNYEGFRSLQGIGVCKVVVGFWATCVGGSMEDCSSRPKPLNPQPSTLKPKPKPSTLNPQP